VTLTVTRTNTASALFPASLWIFKSQQRHYRTLNLPTRLKTTMDSGNHSIAHNSPDQGDKADEADKNLPASLTEGLATLDVSDLSAEVGRLAVDMQQCCRVLLEEIEHFQSHLKRQRRENNVELRTFKSALQAEMKLLDKVSIDYHSAIIVSLC
jgi:hypothetical protein